jgi:PhnB protein
MSRSTTSIVTFERARSAGATILSELEDNPAVSQRQYRAEDIEGHRWMFAQLS